MKKRLERKKWIAAQDDERRVLFETGDAKADAVKVFKNWDSWLGLVTGKWPSNPPTTKSKKAKIARHVKLWRRDNEVLTAEFLLSALRSRNGSALRDLADLIDHGTPIDPVRAFALRWNENVKDERVNGRPATLTLDEFHKIFESTHRRRIDRAQFRRVLIEVGTPFITPPPGRPRKLGLGAKRES